MAGRLDGQVAVITGGSRGVGFATAEVFAAEGATVVICARGREGLEAAREQLTASGAVCHAVPCDVTDDDAVQEMVADVLRRFGRIDILVNNAADFLYKPFLDLTHEEWHGVMDANLNSVYYCCRAVLPHMAERAHGRIINISSIHGKHGDKNLAPHCTAKFGILGLTEALAREFVDRNIRINALCPGQIASQEAGDPPPDHPVGGLLYPKEVAWTALFLASPEGAHITGTTLDIFGHGRTAL